MIDPATAAAVITGLVSSLTAYMTYRVQLKQAERTAVAEPAKPDEATLKQGEAVLVMVERGIQAQGTPDEHTTLAGFQQNPAMFRPVLEAALQALAARSPEFAEQLQALAASAPRRRRSRGASRFPARARCMVRSPAS